MCALQKPTVLALLLGSLALAPAPVVAQGSRPRTSSTLRNLEGKANEAREAYLQQLVDLAGGYEEEGDDVQATAVFRQILQITPENEEIKAHIAELENKIFEENQQVIEVEAGKPWVASGLRVRKGETIRLVSEGSYKFVVTADLGPNGFPVENVQTDMGDGIATGALMGMVLAEGQRGGPPQPTRPFQVGTEREVKPEADGLLYFRLNIPAGSRSNGKVRVMVQGNIAPVGQ
jgi:hypothetical protein